MVFGRLFEENFISQGYKNRTIIDTLDLGWRLLSFLPKDELDRTDEMILDRYYDHEDAMSYFNIEESVIIKELKKEGN
jgi:V/A-type H+-transporting ATPase subunit B